MNYDTLNIEDFGAHLLKTGDLDPVYIALQKLWKNELNLDSMSKWLIAYWCTYHCGLSCYLAEQDGDDFWIYLERVACNEVVSPLGGRWPREKERRHWRGRAAISSFVDLFNKYNKDPTQMLVGIKEAGPKYKDISKFVQSHVGFGPWIAFKVADMAERVLGYPVDFSQAEVFMFKDPVEAALMLWRKKSGLTSMIKPKSTVVQTQIITEVVGYLQDHFNGLPIVEGEPFKKSYRAPPLFDRKIGLQEVETILCKWKSHMKGHYPLGNDIREIKNGLTPWFDVSPLAKEFYEAMPGVYSREV